MEEIIRRFGGIVRTSRLLELGVTRHRMRMNLLAGRAIRPRVGWLAVPDCDPELIRAARVGAVLSCVTQARRLGLWEGPDRRDHLAVPVAGCESREPGVVFHYAEPIYPRERWLLEDSIINVLELVAHCQPFEVAVAV